MFVIKEISSAETISVRHAVLRKGKRVQSCHFIGDNEISTRHFGLFLDQNLVGVASLFQNNNFLLIGNQMQLRGMAILDTQQRKGFGDALLSYAENYCKINSYDVFWFNARETALSFYLASNYTIIGEPFIIDGIGVHYIMYKDLK